MDTKLSDRFNDSTGSKSCTGSSVMLHEKWRQSSTWKHTHTECPNEVINWMVHRKSLKHSDNFREWKDRIIAKGGVEEQKL